MPRRAVALGLVALAIPLAAFLIAPEATAEYQALAWLLLLIPTFMLAYFRGMPGVSHAVGLGIALMVTVHGLLLYWGYVPADPALMIGIAVTYVLIAAGIGFLADSLHRARMLAEELALTDDLTGLPNRRFASQLLEREFAAARRGRPLVIASFDLDRFKAYNDRYGHNAGDNALRVFGQVLSSLTRTMNVSGRWGGEEFLSVLSSSDVAGTLVFVERVRTMLRESPLQHGTITVSVGVAAYHPGMQSLEDLLIAADVALYEAKSAGPDSVRVFQPPPAVARSA